MTTPQHPGRWRQVLVAALRLAGLCLVLSMFASTVTDTWWAPLVIGPVAAFYLWRFVRSVRGFGRTSRPVVR